MTITEFLLARIEEDEHTARQGDHRDVGNDIGWWSMSEGDVLHIGTDRVLAECKVKRLIIEMHPPTQSDLAKNRKFGNGPSAPESIPVVSYDWELMALASVYADHPDYDAAWAV